MKFTIFLATISFASTVFAAPLSLNLRGLLPSPLEAVDALFPNSAIPELVGKLERKLGVCMCWNRMTISDSVANKFSRTEESILGTDLDRLSVVIWGLMFHVWNAAVLDSVSMFYGEGGL